MLKEKRPDIEIVGDELHPLLKVTDFSPYIAKIKASGADSVITGNWGQDFALLLKAAADAGLQANWYTYYAGGAGGPTAIKQTGLSHRVFADHRRRPELRDAGGAGMGEGVPRQGGRVAVLSARGQRDADAGEGRGRGQVDRCEASPQKLEGMKIEVFDGGDGFMRKDDHQFFQPIYISQLRRPRSRREVRRGKHRLGLEAGRRRQGGGHGPSDHLQDGSTLRRGGGSGCPSIGA